MINNLVIEVTRKCNMACAHCLRGEAQAKVFNPDFLADFLNETGLDYIPSVVFTGGEPSLEPGIIRACLDLFKQGGVEVERFYIATNGKRPPCPDEFLHVLIDLARYQSVTCDFEYLPMVEISNDEFHDHEGQDQDWVETLKLFRFCQARRRGASWYSEGRYSDAKNRRVPLLTWAEAIEEGEIYINCEGKIVPGCDFSYEHQEQFGISLQEFITEYGAIVEGVEA